MEKKILCPHCYYEYTPAEIFYPDDLTGRPTNIIRDALGKIIYTEYDPEYEQMTPERFVCEHCGKAFIVEPEVMYRVKKEEEAKDFGNLSASLLDA